MIKDEEDAILLGQLVVAVVLALIVGGVLLWATLS